MAVADLGIVRLFYEVHGAGGPTVLLVHGLAGDADDWEHQVPVLAERHRVIIAELRGHGRSSGPPDGFGPRSLAADMARLVGYLGAGPVVAVGHSLGGVVASALAVDQPLLVAGVVVIDAPYGAEPEDSPAIAEVIRDLRGPQGPDVARSQLALGAPSTTLDRPYRQPSASPRVMAACLSGLFAGDDPIGLRPGTDRYLRRRNCPVLSFSPDPGRAAWEAGVAIHPGSRQLTWAGSGHWMHQERPEAFNAAVLDWIAGLEVPEG